MERLLLVGVSNAAAAAVMGIGVWLVCRIVRRPAVSRALWLLVLLKLLTPPLWNLPIDRWIRPAEQPAVAAPAYAQAPNVDPDFVPAATEDPAPDDVANINQPAPAAPNEAPPPVHPHYPVIAYLVILWLAGTAACLATAALYVRRFRAVLRFSSYAPQTVQDRAEELAVRLGIVRRCPGVWFVPGPVCPMLWATFGPPRLLIPSELWDRLDDAQRDTLLAHELAHYRRGDHWVRALELIATALYWWLPVVWWARHELREAEEQCCDAWVLWALPRCTRSYATTLLEVIDFVFTSRPAVPALASGMGEFSHFRRRLIMIKKGDVGRALTHTGLAAVCAAAGILLPLAPTWGQPPEADQPATVATEAAPPGGLPTAPVTIEAPPGAPAPALQPPAPTPANPTDEVTRLREEVRRLTQELRAARRQLAQLRGPGAPPPGAMPGARNFGGYGALRPPPAAAPPEGAGPMANNPYGLPRPPARAENRDQRLDRLEQSLSRLLDEVRLMREERQPHGRGGPETAPPPPPEPYPDAPATPQPRRF